MNYKKTFLRAFIAFGICSSHIVLASQAPMGSQNGSLQAGASPSHQGKMHSSADSAASVGAHSGKKGTSNEKEASSTKGAHSGKKGASEEKEITPVKKELIDALKNQKESSLHCTGEGSKNHPLTPAVIEEKATKVKKKAGNFVVTLSSGSQVTCAK
jgi:hypothetical protein